MNLEMSSNRSETVLSLAVVGFAGVFATAVKLRHRTEPVLMRSL